MASGINQKVKIAFVVSAYFAISISMVLMNKFLLSQKESIPAPFFVTWYQCVITAIICWLLGLLGKHTDKSSCLHEFPEQHYNIQTAIQILPLSLVFVGMITFNNLCLKYVKVSFYLVARSLTIVFNVVLSFLFLGITTSIPVIICCAIVISGFYIGSEGELEFSLLGTLFGVFSSLFVSLNSIYTKKMIRIVDNNSWILCYYNNMNSILLFIPMIIFFERDIIIEHWNSLYSHVFWGVMTAAGVFGFLIGIVTIAQISLTSPLTHNIAGTAKACLQTIIAVVFLGERLSFRSILGTGCVLFGTFMYSVVRSREMDAKARKSPKIEAQVANFPKEAEFDLENQKERHIQNVEEERPLLVKNIA